MKHSIFFFFLKKSYITKQLKLCKEKNQEK